jgi:chromosome segregation ATPase
MASVQVASQKLESKAGNAQDLSDLLSGMETNLQQAQESGQTDQTAETRQRIIEASFSTLQQSVNAEQLDLAEAMGNLNLLLESLGLEYADFKKPLPQEEAAIRRAKDALAQAQLDRQEAEGAWFKARAIAKADAALEQAKTALEQLEKTVQTAMRNRLMKATIEDNINTFKLACARVETIITARIGDIKKQIEIVRTRRVASGQMQEKSAAAREQLDAQLKELEGQLRQAEELLLTLEKDSPEYAKQNAILNELRSQIETVTGARNAALALFQDQQIFGERLAQHEQVQVKLLSNHNVWLTMLKSQMENRAVTLRSMLEALKAASDQDAAKQIVDMGRGLDAKSDVLMAELDASTQKAMVETFEGFPGFLKKLHEVLGVQAEVDIAVRERFAAVLADVKECYGIDLRETSFFPKN